MHLFRGGGSIQFLIFSSSARSSHLAKPCLAPRLREEGHSIYRSDEYVRTIWVGIFPLQTLWKWVYFSICTHEYIKNSPETVTKLSRIVKTINNHHKIARHCMLKYLSIQAPDWWPWISPSQWETQNFGSIHHLDGYNCSETCKQTLCAQNVRWNNEALSQWKMIIKTWKTLYVLKYSQGTLLARTSKLTVDPPEVEKWGEK